MCVCIHMHIGDLLYRYEPLSFGKTLRKKEEKEEQVKLENQGDHKRDTKSSLNTLAS